MKKWEILSELQIANSKWPASPNRGEQIADFIKVLLKNRGLKTKKEIENFLNPKLETVTVQSVGISSSELKKTINRIKQAIEKKETIVIFGDYDVDGICGTAILWETLYQFTKNVHPYIPHRIDEGYGLSIKGIEMLKSIRQAQDPEYIEGQ